VSESDYEVISRAKKRENHNGLALQIFGFEIHPKAHVAPGTVELVITERA
jgi:hypothetical protein